MQMYKSRVENLQNIQNQRNLFKFVSDNCVYTIISQIYCILNTFKEVNTTLHHLIYILFCKPIII